MLAPCSLFSVTDSFGMACVVVVATGVNRNDVPQVADRFEYALPGSAAEAVADVRLDKKGADNIPGFQECCCFYGVVFDSVAGGGVRAIIERQDNRDRFFLLRLTCIQGIGSGVEGEGSASNGTPPGSETPASSGSTGSLMFFS